MFFTLPLGIIFVFYYCHGLTEWLNRDQFAIGECGMPMERARCPECGSPVGGEGHRAVEGVTRAMDMEG